MRYGINGSARMLIQGIEGVLDSIAHAEAAGFDSYWLGQIGLTDVLSIFGSHGITGSPMELGTAVISTWERHPRMLAGQALTVQSLVDERLVLGIGLNHRPVVEDRLHMDWDRPIRHINEYLSILDDLLYTGRSSFRGQIWSFEDENVRPTDMPPKVMLAALGPQMLDVAGRRTDGTILWCVGPKTIRTHIAPIINDAAAAADRDEPAIVCSLPVWVTDDPPMARQFLDLVLAEYATIPSYRAMLDREGAAGLGDLSIVGSEEYVRDALGEIAEAGATDFSAVPMGANHDEAQRTMDVLIEGLAAERQDA